MKYIATKPIELFEVLREMYPDSSNTTLRDMLKQRRIHVDGQTIVKASYCVQNGQTVCDFTALKNTFHGVNIIYEDRDIVVVNKPAKMLSTPLDTKESINLRDVLREHFRTHQVYAVHRIDKSVSGVMVFARGKQSIKPLNEIFKKHDIAREYIAIVQGKVSEDTGTWKSHLLELKNYNVCSAPPNSREGKKAVTHYTVFHRSAKFSFITLRLETGRKHQIRVHCKEARHPIVGDKRYGDPSCNPISRIGLHAAFLGFEHPITGQKMRFSAPIPSEFSKLGLMPSGYHHGRDSKILSSAL